MIIVENSWVYLKGTQSFVSDKITPTNSKLYHSVLSQIVHHYHPSYNFGRTLVQCSPWAWPCPIDHIQSPIEVLNENPLL